METSLSALARPDRLSDSLYRELETRIHSGEIRPGEKLPSEKRLALEFAVSRAVVREAMSRLKAEGYVDSRQGAGAFVTQRPGTAIFRLSKNGPRAAATLSEVFELRLIVEGEAAALAALRRQAGDIAAMQRHIDNMEQALHAGADGTHADDAFHRAVAEASGNALVGRFIEFLGEHLIDSRAPTWSSEGHALGRARVASEEHRRLLAAIDAGDAARARVEAREHVLRAAEHLGLRLAPAAASTETRFNTDKSGD
ncbi:MAG: FadR family transcriptional regulator [Rhodocyclaceae bacterium]|nr:FadR family transcriptional regulator [Rhodocyclaceae bacterium]MBX3668400.1 FadR family transcriptional regulator [Rhodocyclaceae bacterium]